MKRIVCVIALSSLPACSGTVSDEGESVGESSQALNGELSAQGFLVRRNFVGSFEEEQRRLDTDRYYVRPGVNPDGSGFGIDAELRTLSTFRAFYGFDGREVVAYYYNRGDLGLGREMHCVDYLDTLSGQAACYVTNFAAGDAGSEFTFGMSPDIAFDNMRENERVATVAMVFRRYAEATRENVMFIVYDQNDRLSQTAPLDRHGLNFFNAFDPATGENPDPSFGTPGIELNNHVPSNCLNCHGGNYDPSGPGNSHRNAVGAYFLPFDLDQFAFESLPGRTRADQEAAFRQLNQIVRGVAVAIGGDQLPIVKQIDGWYGNSGSPILTGNFKSSYVPPGWSGTQQDIDIYRQVVRPSCRGCHLTNAFTFDDAAQFRALSTFVANDISSLKMPHALQTQRDFWQSSQPLYLENYFRSIGAVDAANTVRLARPGFVVTLDPPQIMSAL
jgi:hypothetical protein